MNFDSLIEGWKDDIVRATQEIVKIRSIEEDSLPGKPFGEGVNQALEYALDLADRLGFFTKNLEGYAGYAEYGNGEETLGILVHLDVVPEGDDWDYPPFGGEIADGKIYGRGTTDDKGPAIAALYALKAVQESGFPMNRKVRIIFGTNEETNWGCMKYYLSKEKSPDLAFVPDADYPLINGEKGFLNLTFKFNFSSETKGDCPWLVEEISGGIRANMVPDYCQARLNGLSKAGELKMLVESYKKENSSNLEIEEKNQDIIIKCYGLSAHGSLPEKGQNAISCLMDFLSQLGLGQSPAGKLVDFYRKYIGLTYNGELLDLGLSDNLSGKLTFNVGTLNFHENQGEFVANIRIPISFTPNEVITRVEKKLQGLPVAIVPGKATNSYYIPEADLLVQKLLKVYQEQTGDYSVKPMTIGGATYARALTKAVPFGPLFPGQAQVAHEKNEFISIDDLVKNTKIYAHAIYQLTR